MVAPSLWKRTRRPSLSADSPGAEQDPGSGRRDPKSVPSQPLTVARTPGSPRGKLLYQEHGQQDWSLSVRGTDGIRSGTEKARDGAQ